MAPEIFAETGKDGTVRRFTRTIVVKDTYLDTICSWNRCSKQYVSGNGAAGRYCSNRCRQADFKAKLAAAGPSKGQKAPERDPAAPEGAL